MNWSIVCKVLEILLVVAVLVLLTRKEWQD